HPARPGLRRGRQSGPPDLDPGSDVRPTRFAALALALVLCATGCGAKSKSSGGTAEEITLYTSVTQNTVDATVAGFKAAHPGAKVTVFRATTGQLNARIAADKRSGGLGAD